MTALHATRLDVVELRRYAMRAGRRDELLALFEREFIESQEECGMVPIGHYRDLGDSESFVWFRGYEGMARRRDALEAFYVRSSAWLNHRDAANATIVDSDNVLLLRPARAASGFDLRGLHRGESGDTNKSRALVLATIMMLNAPAADAFVKTFETEVLPKLKRCAERVAYFVTEEQPNNFPRLPVREGEFAFVVVGISPSVKSADAWEHDVAERDLPALMRAQLVQSESLRLQPAARALFS